MTPFGKFLFACQKGLTPIVEALVEAGVDIHKCDEWGLRIAAQHGHLDVVKYLIEQGADVHARNDHALRSATTENHIEVVNYLKEISKNERNI